MGAGRLTPELDALRDRAILSSLAGFPFLLVFGIVWIAGGFLSYVVPDAFAPWIYVAVGMPAMPVAILLEKRLGYVPAADPDPLLGLTLPLLFVQIVAFPAILIVWDAAPAYVPVAFAAIVGAHFLPYAWVYRTRMYVIVGVVVAVGPYLLAIVAGSKVLHYTGFLVGPALLAGAFVARSHAKATWLASGRSREPGLQQLP